MNWRRQIHLARCRPGLSDGRHAVGVFCSGLFRCWVTFGWLFLPSRNTGPVGNWQHDIAPFWLRLISERRLVTNYLGIGLAHGNGGTLGLNDLLNDGCA